MPNGNEAFSPFNIPCVYQICSAKSFHSYKDNLHKNLDKTPGQECKKSTSGWCASLKKCLFCKLPTGSARVLAALKHGNIIILICQSSRLHVCSPSFGVVKSEGNNVSPPIKVISFLRGDLLSLWYPCGKWKTTYRLHSSHNYSDSPRFLMCGWKLIYSLINSKGSL